MLKQNKISIKYIVQDSSEIFGQMTIIGRYSSLHVIKGFIPLWAEPKKSLR